VRIFKLTPEGRRKLKIPSQRREPVLDYLYDNNTATLDELEAIDKDARAKLRQHKGLVEEI